jgi:S-adenosylmethionine:tRNA ribosyltransferase-isomerase
VETADLDYFLPPDRIAQAPRMPRDAARLLVDQGPDRPAAHHRVADLPDLLEPGDLLVVNDTRVRRARLRLQRPTGGAAEVLLLEPVGDGWWEAVVRPNRKLPEGTVLTGPDGVRVAMVGDVPLPPYIHERLADDERYQTVYARRTASAAAPTAGLHLTDGVLASLGAMGVAVATVELVVGLDTFRPISAEVVEAHPIHTESYEVPAATLDAVAATRASGGAVVAVGTTVVRALESTMATGSASGRTSLFIRPGFEFRAVDRLLTNFHVPRTTLLALVAAFVGERWRHLYDVALDEGYRFLSFGDAMLLTREGRR